MIRTIKVDYSVTPPASGLIRDGGEGTHGRVSAAGVLE